jgi:hypothetical protein
MIQRLNNWKAPVKDSKVFHFEFEHTSPTWKIHALDEAAYRMQTFHPFALYVGEGLLPWASPYFQAYICPWANTLLTTPMTLKLREALGSKDSPIPKGP